jgi:hypothetical protein
MHTSVFESCRIHYNGDVILTNEDSTSKSISDKSTIEIPIEQLEAAYNISDFGVSQITIFDTKDKNNKSITVLKKDVESFLKYRLLDKITNKLNNTERI